MNNKDILNIALRQTAIDSACTVDDLTSINNIVVISKPNDNARRYLNLPFFCDLVSYGSNIVASVDERIVDFITNYINTGTIEHCFETPKLHLLTNEFSKYGKIPCFMAEYFLPDAEVITSLPCNYKIKILKPGEFKCLYNNQWNNALSVKRQHLDMLVAAAYDGNEIIGVAGCSADCDSMWQIGVDVKPQYRKKGIASAVTSHLAIEILKQGKVPFYCCAWSNISSVRNAIKSGFRPAWVHLTSINVDKAAQFTI